MTTNPSKECKRSVFGSTIIAILLYFSLICLFITQNPLFLISLTFTILLYFRKPGTSTVYRILYSYFQFAFSYAFLLCSLNLLEKRYIKNHPTIYLMSSIFSLFLGAVFVSKKSCFAKSSTFYEPKECPTISNFQNSNWSAYRFNNSTRPSFMLSPVNPFDENIPPSYDDVLKEL